MMARSRRHGSAALILKSEIYNFHRLDLIRRAGFVVTIYDEDGLRLAARRSQLPPKLSSFHESSRLAGGPKNPSGKLEKTFDMVLRAAGLHRDEGK
jgi:hypothetical protein